MFEAVGERWWPSYFNALQRLLKPGGRAVVQSITIRDDLFARYRRGTDFIQQHVFPGGMLPSPSAFAGQVSRAGLALTHSHSFGPDYARTLAAADVMVFPSLTDTFGLVMLEAMACGTPVAAYNAPSPLDVVEDGVTGAIAATLEDAIARAMPLPRAAVVEGSMRFSWKTCADMFESWLVPCGSITPGTSPGQFAAALPR